MLSVQIFHRGKIEQKKGAGWLLSMVVFEFLLFVTPWLD